MVCLEMMRDRHAQRLILVPSYKFVGYGSVDADDEAEGLEAPYINQSKWMATLLWKLLVPLRMLDIYRTIT